MDDDLRKILARYPAIARPLDLPEALGNAGGLSGSNLWRYPSGSGTLLARAWPIDGPPRRGLETIHRWLADARDLGFVPVPLADLDGRTLPEQGGRFWEVAPWMAGRAEEGQRPPASHIRAAFAALAAFHQRLARHRKVGPSLGLKARLVELQAWTGGGLNALARLLTTRTDDPLRPASEEWVELARGRGREVADVLTRSAGLALCLQPCLRDVRPEHFLFTGDSVTGLVDFGAMGFESVAADLARLIVEWSLDDPGDRDTALTSYASIRPLSPVETALIDVFERSGSLLLGGHWLRWHFVEGREFRAEDAVAGGIARGVERLRSLGARR